MDIILEIKNLFYSYDKQSVLEDITLNVLRNDFLAIIGPNGGGKTTLLKLILGLLELKDGKIIKKISNNHIGYVPQNTNLNTDFPITALEVVLMGHINKKKLFFSYSKEDKACAMNSLKEVEMNEFANVKIGNLSGGQRQRIFIARALCSKPKLMLLDEPTANIDVKGQKDIYNLLQKLNKSICIIVVSHDISVLLNYAKNVAHINKNLVYHKLSHIKKDFALHKHNDHLCEVELLSSLGQMRGLNT